MTDPRRPTPRSRYKRIVRRERKPGAGQADHNDRGATHTSAPSRSPVPDCDLWLVMGRLTTPMWFGVFGGRRPRGRLLECGRRTYRDYTRPTARFGKAARFRGGGHGPAHLAPASKRARPGAGWRPIPRPTHEADPVPTPGQAPRGRRGQAPDLAGRPPASAEVAGGGGNRSHAPPPAPTLRMRASLSHRIVRPVELVPKVSPRWQCSLNLRPEFVGDPIGISVHELTGAQVDPSALAPVIH